MSDMVERAAKPVLEFAFAYRLEEVGNASSVDAARAALLAALDLTEAELAPLQHEGDTPGAWKYNEGVADTLAALKAMAQGETGS